VAPAVRRRARQSSGVARLARDYQIVPFGRTDLFPRINVLNWQFTIGVQGPSMRRIGAALGSWRISSWTFARDGGGDVDATTQRASARQGI
jgi:hypothetical protein